MFSLYFQLLALLSRPFLLHAPQRDWALLHQLQPAAGQAQGLEEGEVIGQLIPAGVQQKRDPEVWPEVEENLKKVSLKNRNRTNKVASKDIFEQ